MTEGGRSPRRCLKADGSIRGYETADCKENESPNKILSTDLMRSKDISSVARELMNDRLQSMENVCTPVRRSTFVKAKSASSCDSSPQQKMKFDGGYQTENGSPVAIPDALATPVRRSTFVKNVPNSSREDNSVPAEHKVRSTESCNQTFIRHISGTSEPFAGEVTGLKCGAADRKCTELLENSDNVRMLCSERGPCISRQLKDERDDKELLKDISQSPQLLEEKLLKLQKQQQLKKRSISNSKVSRQLSPGSDSEYHTAAMTTPFDESFDDNNEFQDSIMCPVHDSMISSCTVTCEMHVCQEVWSATTAVVTNDSQNTGNGDVDGILLAMETNQRLSNETYRIDRRHSDENVGMETGHGIPPETQERQTVNETIVLNTRSKLHDYDRLAPEIGFSADYRTTQLDVTTTVSKELFVIIPTASDSCVSHEQYLEQTECKDSLLEAVFSERSHSDILMNENKRLSSTPAFFRNNIDNSASSCRLNQWLPRASAPSPIDFAPFGNSVNNHHGCKGKPSEVADDGCFRRPLPVGTSTRSQSVPSSNNRKNPLQPTDVAMSGTELNHTFVKSVNLCSSACSMDQENLTNQTFVKAQADYMAGRTACNRKTSSRHLFVEEQDRFGVMPLDSSHVDGIVGVRKLGDGTVTVSRHADISGAEVRVNDLVSSKDKAVGYWSDTEVSHISSKQYEGKFVPVGGQSSHMISPGQKRQSLIAKLNSTEAVHQKGTTVVPVSCDQLPKPVKLRSVDADGASNRSRSLSSSRSVASRKMLERDRSLDNSAITKRQEPESASNTKGEILILSCVFKNHVLTA
jgi:hypothetical protein